MRNSGSSQLEGLVLSLVVLFSGPAHGQMGPKNGPAAQSTHEYSVDNFPYLSFVELKELSVDMPLSPELTAKLQSVLGSVIVGRDGTAAAQFPESRAGSTGRCNTGLEFTRRGFKAQGLSRALIEAQSYLVEIGLRVDGQVGFLREVLS